MEVERQRTGWPDSALARRASWSACASSAPRQRATPAQGGVARRELVQDRERVAHRARLVVGFGEHEVDAQRQ
jgi:hypothetical protein